MNEIPEDIPDKMIQTTTEVVITVRELYKLVYIDLLSDAKIGEIYDLSAKTIRNYRKKCEFETTFKTGRMDLPLSAIVALLSDGKDHSYIAKYFDTTKTSVKAFCIRHGLSNSGQSEWPVARQTMFDLVLAEFTNEEIARKYYIIMEEVEDLQKKYGITPFSGVKTYKGFGLDRTVDQENTHTDVKSILTIQERARIYFGARIYYDKRLGWMLDEDFISSVDLRMKVLEFESLYNVEDLLDRHAP